MWQMMAKIICGILQNWTCLIDTPWFDVIMLLCQKQAEKNRKEEVYYAKNTLVSSRDQKLY